MRPKSKSKKNANKLTRPERMLIGISLVQASYPQRVTPKWHFNISLSDVSRSIFCLSHPSSNSTMAVYFSANSTSRMSRL